MPPISAACAASYPISAPSATSAFSYPISAACAASYPISAAWATSAFSYPISAACAASYPISAAWATGAACAACLADLQCCLCYRYCSQQVSSCTSSSFLRGWLPFPFSSVLLKQSPPSAIPLMPSHLNCSLV
ncbi:hypothetical protein DUNSADRAFT_13845 [Dunaliella salina]|uniref:Uncharacterized protein n=1 Tax=Dunaliella salina TaxID=3046 RepID=A0ABQ7G8K7_DUNSA|nr:hypothetical protein DUNSADRAFT_13845 [Dunaliella salina]|eukprot:KAF5830913.1 hypothetical protein DUNSADRAFT_13845 [Dunaliella salina]